jgi:hypothetical protein
MTADEGLRQKQIPSIKKFRRQSCCSSRIVEIQHSCTVIRQHAFSDRHIMAVRNMCRIMRCFFFVTSQNEFLLTFTPWITLLHSERKRCCVVLDKASVRNESWPNAAVILVAAVGVILTVKGKRQNSRHNSSERKQKYISTLSLTSALDGGGWLITPQPGRFSLWKQTPYPFYKRWCRPQLRSGRLP